MLRGKRHCMMAWAAMVLLMTSCSWGDELEATYATTDDATTLSTTRTTTLLIPLSLESSDDTDESDGSERQLNNLWVFVYDSSSTNSPKKIVYISDDATEGYDYEQDAYLTIDIGGSNDITGGTYDIYAIANAGSSFSDTNAEISETVLEAKTSSYTATTLPSTESGLMMEGHTYGKYIAAKDTTVVDLSMEYINAKVGYKFLYDISDTQHFTYTVNNTTYSSVSAAYGEVKLKVTKVEIQQVAGSQTVVVRSSEQSSTDNTFTYTYGEEDFPVYGNGSGKVQISDTLYLPEHYVSSTNYQTKIVITGTFTTPAGDELEQTYSFTLGGDATNGTVEASNRTGLTSLNRGYSYIVDCYVGYKVDGIFTSQVTAQDWTTSNSTDVDTDEQTD